MVIYKENYFAGTSAEYSGPSYVSSLGTWNDQIRSLIVTTVTTTTYDIVGYWTSVASGNGAISYTATVGVTYESSSTTSTSVGASITA